MHVVTLAVLAFAQGHLSIISAHATADTIYHALVTQRLQPSLFAGSKLILALSTGTLIQRIHTNVRDLIERRLNSNLSEYIDKRYLKDEGILRTLDYAGPTTEVSYAHDDTRHWAASCANFLILALRVFPGSALILLAVYRRVGIRPMMIMAVAMRVAMLLGRIVGTVTRKAPRGNPRLGWMISFAIRALVAISTTIASACIVPLLSGTYHDRVCPGGFDSNGDSLVSMWKAPSMVSLVCAQLSSVFAFLTQTPAKQVAKAMVYNCKLYQSEKFINDIRRRVVKQTRSHIRGVIANLDYISVQSIAVLEEPYQPRTSKALIHHLSFHVKPGNNTLIMGPSRCGRSSILRLIGEYLPLHEGGISKPTNSTALLYISNNTFVPRWTLKMHLTHPQVHGTPSTVGENELLGLLEQVGLGDIFEKYNSLEDWDTPLTDLKDVLTKADSQRLGLARVLYHRPAFALLDEATDLVSAEDEAAFFDACAQHHITCLSVSNSPRMWAKHTHGLVIGTRGDSRRPGGFTGSLTPSKNSSFASVPNSPPRASSSSGEKSFSYFFGAMSVAGSTTTSTEQHQALQGEVSGSTDSTPLGNSSKRQSSVATASAYSLLQLHFPRIINAKDARRIGTGTTITQSHYT